MITLDWINALFTIPSPVQAVVVISLIIAVGTALSKIKFMGVSLGVSFVFFIGIIAGNLGLSVDSAALNYAETFGLVLFVYTLGLYVGPNFFGAFRHEGTSFNLWGLAVVVLGTVLAVALCPLTGISLPTMVGLLCGATTNTPALGAAQQALEHMSLPTGGVALATAVTYPLGVVGVILGILIMRKLFVKPADLVPKSPVDEDHTFVCQFLIVNPAIEGRTIGELAMSTPLRFIVSRVWRQDEVLVPGASTHLHTGDNLMVVTNREDVSGLEILFGQRVERDWNNEEIDWNHIDRKVESRVIVLTRTALNGKLLGRIHLRESFGVNVSRITRGDVKLLATKDLRLQYGDRLTVVGEPKRVDSAEHFLGNSVKTLNEPNVGSIFFGMILGLALGSIPISFPGMDSPIRLGIAGGPIIMGILVGALGPHMHFISYTTRSASLMLRRLGLAMYLACLGLDAGKDFFSTVFRPEGLLWVGIGALLTIVPVLIVGCIALRTKKLDYGTICGILCGAMANPMALSYANDTIEGDTPSISYATVYPIGMFVRVIIAQVLIMFFV